MSKSSSYRENYNSIHLEIVELLKAARAASARSINAFLVWTAVFSVETGPLEPSLNEKRSKRQSAYKPGSVWPGLIAPT